MFIGRVELLPEDETVEDHQRAKDEEAGLLAADRAGPGLFKGVFLGLEPNTLASRNWRQGVLDSEDNVVRCPDCHWELEEGTCNRCGFHEFDVSDSGSDIEDDGLEGSIDLDSSTMESDAENDDEFAATMGGIYGRRVGLNPYDDEDDEDNDMDGFIDNEAQNGDSDSDADTESTMTIYNRQFGRIESYNPSTSRRASVQSDTPIPFGYDSPQYTLNGPTYTPASPVRPNNNGDQSDTPTNYDEMTEESDSDLPTPRQPARRSRRMRVISDDDDDDDNSEDSDDSESSTVEQQAQNRNEVDNDDEDESESSMTEASHPDSDSESDSDESIRPPQPSTQRRQYANVQQPRHGEYNPHQGYQERTHPTFPARGQDQYPQRQQSHRGRGASHRYQPYQRPYGRRIPVGGGNRGYPM